MNRLKLIFQIPELRQKILLTLVLLAVYRLGFSIPLPFIDQSQLKQLTDKLASGSGEGIGKVMSMLSLLSASNIAQSTIFGLGIMPYISASIIFQLLGQVYPPLEQLQKEGEAGRRKINEYTRYATVVICLFQSFFWVRLLVSNGLGDHKLVLDGFDGLFMQLVCTLTMTAGTVLLMWIGEQIDEFGIGNGVSLLIMAGILARMPEAGWTLLKPALDNGVKLGTDTGIEKLLMLVVLFVAVIWGVVLVTQAQRRIPIQSGRHVRGRRAMGGGPRQFLPLRLNQSGVMPIIFASSLLMFPLFLFSQLANWFPQVTIVRIIHQAFQNQGGFVYNLIYVGLIYFFAYFWSAVTFNPKEISNNLRDHGSFIPGYRPGVRTGSFLEQVINRITFVGAGFLAIVAIVPTIFSSAMGIDPMVASFYGGTGLLIVVSVALDLVQKIDSHLVMRNYPGLLESDE